MPSFDAPQIFPSISLIPLAQLLTWGSDLQMVSTPLHHLTNFSLINLAPDIEHGGESRTFRNVCPQVHMLTHSLHMGWKRARGYSESQMPLNKSSTVFLLSPTVALSSFSCLTSRSWYLFSKILPSFCSRPSLTVPIISTSHKHYDCYCDPLGWQQDRNIFKESSVWGRKAFPSWLFQCSYWNIALTHAPDSVCFFCIS